QRLLRLLGQRGLRDVPEYWKVTQRHLAGKYKEEQHREADHDSKGPYTNECSPPPSPSPRCPAAQHNELPLGFRNILGTFYKPVLRLRERETHQHCLFLCAARRSLPRATCGFDPRFPSEKFALVTDPAAQLIPAPEDRYMCHFRVGLAAFGRRSDKQAVWMVGKL